MQKYFDRKLTSMFTLGLSVLLGLNFVAQANEISANIDASDIRFVWSGVPSVRAGQNIYAGPLRMAGMLEVQNEARFNEEILPNHTWRGYGAIEYATVVWSDSAHAKQKLSFPIGVRHESSHASMGVQEPTNSAYEMIFDGAYRNTNRNVIAGGIQYDWKRIWQGQIRAEALRYVYSRNTPEALNTSLTNSWGATVGMDARYPIWGVNLLLSVWYRQEWESQERFDSYVYFDSPSGVQSIYVNYPVFVSNYTASVLAGVEIPWGTRSATIFGQYRQGHAGGFIDSRESRKVFSGGLRFIIPSYQ